MNGVWSLTLYTLESVLNGVKNAGGLDWVYLNSVNVKSGVGQEGNVVMSR